MPVPLAQHHLPPPNRYPLPGDTTHQQPQDVQKPHSPPNPRSPTTSSYTMTAQSPGLGNTQHPPPTPKHWRPQRLAPLSGHVRVRAHHNYTPVNLHRPQPLPTHPSTGLISDDQQRTPRHYNSSHAISDRPPRPQHDPQHTPHNN